MKAVSYLRVSTHGQGQSGLGLAAQRSTVESHVAQRGLALVREYVEVESGKRSSRQVLQQALQACKLHGAVLVVPKVDRLARNTSFLLSIVENLSSIQGILFCDMPMIDGSPHSKFAITVMAANAELEGAMISQRTKDALAQAKKRGVKLGNPNLKPGDPSCAAEARKVRSEKTLAFARMIWPEIEDCRAQGCKNDYEIAKELTYRGIKTATGKVKWHATQVARIRQLLKRRPDTPDTQPADSLVSVQAQER